MAADIRARLRDAMSAGEVLGIVYRGGSQPGAFRLILPVSIEGDKVRARCYTSKAVKLFSLAKIELRDATAPPSGSSVTWAHLPEVVWTFSTIDEVARYFRPQIEAKGWHVEHGPFDDGDSLRLHARLKSGKPRRSPAIVFSYEPKAWDLVETEDGRVVRVNERPRVRPWALHANGKSSSWGRVDKAVHAFRTAAGICEAGGPDVSGHLPVSTSDAAAADAGQPQASPPLESRVWRWFRDRPRPSA